MIIHFNIIVSSFYNWFW